MQGTCTSQSTKPDSASNLTSAVKVNTGSGSVPNSTEEARSIKTSSSAGGQALNVQSSLWDITLQKLSLEERAAIQQTYLNSKLEIVEKLHGVFQQKRDKCREK